MKIFVEVMADTLPNGKIIPKEITWEDENDTRTFKITGVLDMVPLRSTKVGGEGMRYLCLIGNQRRYLYFSDRRWWVEVNK